MKFFRALWIALFSLVLSVPAPAQRLDPGRLVSSDSQEIIVQCANNHLPGGINDE